MIAVTILGNNSAIPSNGRHPTAQIVQTDQHTFLIDCGEGTQMQINHYKIRKSKIEHIFISHLHGDHYFGLVGLLNSYSLAHRTAAIHIYCPALLKDIIELQLNAALASFTFPCHFHFLKKSGIIFQDEGLEISCFPVVHRIECWGFLFREIRHSRSILKKAVWAARVPLSFYENLQNGEDYVDKDGKIHKNENLTVMNKRGKSYAFCADTLYHESLCDYISGVDLLYHESTYLDELRDKAAARFHSTTKQAAMIAKKANVNKLLLGHFSSRYALLEKFGEEARTIFENTEVSNEGTTYLA